MADPADAGDFSEDDVHVERGENLLELKILEGELDVDTIQRLLTERGVARQDADFTTMVCVDFHTHDTRTTAPTQGGRPQYRTHLSFIITMDPESVQHLYSAR